MPRKLLMANVFASDSPLESHLLHPDCGVEQSTRIAPEALATEEATKAHFAADAATDDEFGVPRA